MRRAIRSVASSRSGFGAFVMNKMPKPWAMVARTKRGAATDDALYIAVGAALSTWELVEEGLAELFALFIGAPEAGPASGHQPAIRAYGSVISFKGRIEMVSAAAQAFFHKEPDSPVYQQFGRLMVEASGYSGRRNDIAHGRVQLMPGKGFYVFPGLYNSSKNPVGREAVYAYNDTQVHHYREGFRALSEKLTDYAVFAGTWEPSKSFQKKPPRQPAQHQKGKRRKSRGKHARQPQS
jgi:hypothetical protein